MQILVNDFDITKLSFGEIKKLDNAAKYVPLYYDKGPFVIQTPQCYAPYGMNVFTNKDKDGTTVINESHTIELSFKDRETRTPLQKYFSILEQIDALVLEEAAKNSQSWLRKPANKDVIEALFTPTIKYPKDKNTGEIIDKYPPTFRLKIKKDLKDQFKCSAYDAETSEEVSMEDMMPQMKGSKITAIANCTGVWLAASKFGISWNASKLRVTPNTGLGKFAFREAPEDLIDGVTDSKTTAVAPVAPVAKQQEEVTAEVSNDVETSDEEVDDDDDDSVIDEVDEPEPVKKTVKKKSTAAKK
jgi:hypothetical protein